MGRVVLVTGGRDFHQRFDVDTVLCELQPYMVVQGDCPTGADKFAKEWAIENERPYLSWPAQWLTSGKAAGPLRNKIMAEAVNHMFSDRWERLCVYFPGGTGTESCKRICDNLGFAMIDGSRYANETHDRINKEWE